MPDILSETAKILSELKRMHQLNYELIEQLNVTCQWIVDNRVEISNIDKLQSLITKSLSLMNEVQAEIPAFIFHDLSDASYHEGQNRRKVNRTEKSYCLNT